MTEHFPNPNPEDEEGLSAEDFGLKEGGVEKIRKNSKNGSQKEKDKKPQRGGIREIKDIPQEEPAEDKTKKTKTPKSGVETDKGKLKKCSLQVLGGEAFFELSSSGNYLVNEETQEIYPPDTVTRGSLLGLTQVFAYFQPDDSPTGQFSIKLTKPAKYENSSGKFVVTEKGRIEVSPMTGLNTNPENKKLDTELSPIKKDISSEPPKTPPKIEVKKEPINQDSKLELIGSEEGYFPLRRARLEAAAKTAAQENKTPPKPPLDETEQSEPQSWKEILKNPELLDAARAAIASKQTKFGIFQFMKRRMSYSPEKIQNLYDELKSLGIIKFENGEEKIIITEKDLDLKNSSKLKVAEKKTKPESKPRSEPAAELKPEIEIAKKETTEENSEPSLEKIKKQTIENTQKYKQELEIAKKEDEINSPEIQKLVQEKFDLLADIRRLNWELTITLEKIEKFENLGPKKDKLIVKLNELNVSYEPHIQERFTKIGEINLKITDLREKENISNPEFQEEKVETSEKAGPEEIRDLKTFINGIQTATKAQLEGIKMLIESEEKKPPRGLTLQYLKQADDALRALWNATIEAPIDTVNLKETQRILGDLTTATTAFLEKTGEKIAAQTSSFRNAEKIKKYLNSHDYEYESLGKKLGDWFGKFKPVLIRTTLATTILFSLYTQEIKEGLPEKKERIISVDSVKPKKEEVQTPTAKKFGYAHPENFNKKQMDLMDSLAEEYMPSDRFDMLTYNAKITKEEYDHIKDMTFKDFMIKYLSTSLIDTSLSKNELEHRQNFAKEISKIKNIDLNNKSSVEDYLVEIYYKKGKEIKKP